MKKKFETERNDTDKIKLCFVNEVIKNGVSCKWFYIVVEGVENFVKLIYQKIRLD